MLAALLRLTLDVRTASHVGALLAGEPAMGPQMDCIAWRESRHELVGIHAADAWMARRLGDGWSTRGVHGQVAAYSWPYVPAWLRWGPWVLDVPLVSALVATRRAVAPQCRQVRACIAWARCA